MHNKKKILSEPKIEGSFFNLINSIYKKLTANILLRVKVQMLSFEDWNKARTSTLTVLIQHKTASSNYSSKGRKRNKRHKYWKEEIKRTLFANYMIVDIENPKGGKTRNCPELICGLRKVM